ncbi:NAD(P)/FAD-dependent oxidoreductase [Arthrobacter antibioticus]|uniref:NAD(P)/FAD-dependent oxidoreductase n=1 Tax=Arthrobacter sp. H35-MC1 TaxID=3046203 RepID=UPI0024B9434B|nr:FAD-dependent oxidoreductase [Arthrobacter sp. H35-MC1]MDJ0316919.1 FAD-dependent oxidoreductase [Arthrobacter sp. H35-MC1]
MGAIDEKQPHKIPHILILGGGYVGLYTAWGLRRSLPRSAARITVVEPNPYMTYQPLLPEVAGGELDARSVAVDLSRALKGMNLFRGRLISMDVSERTAHVESITGATSTMDFDHVVLAMGAVSRTFPTPGLKEQGIGFKTLAEAVHVRNKVLGNIAAADAATDPAQRAKALTFVFVGGGYTGVEALCELSDLAKLAVDEHPTLDRSELRFVLVEALDRVAPEVGPTLSKFTLAQLRERGVGVRLKTTMKSCTDGQVVLSDGSTFEANTIVWTAGVKPNPVLDNTDVPRGPKGHVSANSKLQVIDKDGIPVPGIWAAGDNAQVPDLNAAKQPAFYAPNAQNAMRQAKVLAQNIVADLDGEPLIEFRHKSLGTLASYGVGRGAAVVLGIELKNRPAWLVDRLYHGLAVPTFNRKWHVFAAWFAGAFAKRDLTALPEVEHPRRAFLETFTRQD